jgi:hypothetical protein
MLFTKTNEQINKVLPNSYLSLDSEKGNDKRILIWLF